MNVFGLVIRHFIHKERKRRNVNQKGILFVIISKRLHQGTCWITWFITGKLSIICLKCQVFFLHKHQSQDCTVRQLEKYNKILSATKVQCKSIKININWQSITTPIIEKNKKPGKINRNFCLVEATKKT